MTRAATTDALLLRALDRGTDLPALAELIEAVNHLDDVPYFPTVEGLSIDMAPVSTFDPALDTQLAFEDGRLVAAAQVEWRERDASGPAVEGRPGP